MDENAKPKTRFDLVSRGIGTLSGGLMMLLIGGIAIFFNRDLGLSLLLSAVMFLAWGIFRIVGGAQASQKDVVCPQCGEKNELLAGVVDFKCFKCEKPLKLVRK